MRLEAKSKELILGSSFKPLENALAYLSPS